MARRWQNRPEGSNWGEFGDDDQSGSLNYITPDRVQAAVGDPERVHIMCSALDGSDQALLDWISRSAMAAIATDNYAVERIAPSANPHAIAFVPLHYHCLFKRGVPLGELWHLTELAHWLRSRRRTAFLLTAPPLRLPGAVGSPVTPVATV